MKKTKEYYKSLMVGKTTKVMEDIKKHVEEHGVDYVLVARSSECGNCGSMKGWKFISCAPSQNVDMFQCVECGHKEVA